MPDNSHLFLDAWGSPKEEDQEPKGDLGIRNREQLFATASGVDTERKNYTPDPIIDYEVEHKRGADVGNLLMLDEAMKAGTQYRDLPLGLRELVKPKRPLAKELRRQEDETGMSLEQREKAFDALQYNVDFISSMEEAGLPASMIAEEYKKLQGRYPEQAIDESLAETNQQLLAKLKAEAKAQAYAAEQARQAADKERNEAQVAAEIADAKAAIEAFKSAAAFSDDELKNELTRRASERTRLMGEL